MSYLDLFNSISTLPDNLKERGSGLCGVSKAKGGKNNTPKSNEGAFILCDNFDEPVKLMPEAD